MTLNYTTEQMIRESQLLVTELAVLTNFVVGEHAGLRALGIEQESDFGHSYHPDNLHDFAEMDLFAHIQRVESYVKDQQWSHLTFNSLTSLRVAVERTFSPTVIAGYEAERADGEYDGEVPDPFADGAGDVPLGYFHRGILAGLVDLAYARMKVDRNDRLTMGEIALLIDAKEPMVVSNAHRKNFVTVEDENKRYAEAADVLPWLIKQGYLETQNAESGNEDEQEEAAASQSDVVFVPVARDGTSFSPECRSGGRYTIGAKGSEVKYTDFWDALAALTVMPTPRWRRPNTNGIPGIVSGIDFERMRRSDLMRQLA